MGEEGGLMTPETEITRGGEWGGGGERKTKNLLGGECGNFLEQHISCKIAIDENFNKF